MITLAVVLSVLMERQDSETGRAVQEFVPTEWDLSLLPSNALYRPYIADPREPFTGTKVQFPVRKGDHLKIENTLGGNRPLAQWSDPNHPERDMGLSLTAAAFSRFDIDEAWDMDAADYRFGFPFAYRDGPVVLKIALYHLTSHLGDEFMTRGAGNGRSRDSYHLEELVMGASWQASPEVRFYSEGGTAVYAGTDTGNGRVQVGAEWVAETDRWLVPYSALDLETRNEIDWGVNGTLQVGFLTRSRAGGMGFRFLLEYYRGHDQQTQFKSDHQQYVSLGVGAEF